MLIAAGVTIVSFFIVLTSALCLAAGEADEKMEQWIRERKREEQEFDGWKWCEDDCYRCPENDWCKFSEVKNHDK